MKIDLFSRRLLLWTRSEGNFRECNIGKNSLSVIISRKFNTTPNTKHCLLIIIGCYFGAIYMYLLFYEVFEHLTFRNYFSSNVKNKNCLPKVSHKAFPRRFSWKWEDEDPENYYFFWIVYNISARKFENGFML